MDPQAEEIQATALAAVERFARVLALTGISRAKMASAFQEACAGLPESLFQSGRRLNHKLLESGHVLSVWLSDPNYLDQQGQPLPIRLRGAPPSLEALLGRINSDIQIDEVVKYLVRTGSIAKVGRRYRIRRTSVSVSRDPELAYAHGLQTVLALLNTIENNAQPIEDEDVCFEFTASNTRFPTRLRGEFDTRLRRLGMDFLRRLDADMRRAEDSRRHGEPTLRMSVGLFQSEQNNPPPTSNASRASARASGRK